MTSEKAVRQTVHHISSTTVTRRLHMISSPIGSDSMIRIASCSGVSRVMRAGAAMEEATSIRRFSAASTLSRSPGARIVVASRSSMIAGP